MFENRRNEKSFNKAQLDEIARICKDTSIFKQGIYARDQRKGDINGVYRSTNLGHIYTTNIKSLIGNDFKIDSSKINVTGEIQHDNTLEKLNLQLATLGFDRVISNTSMIDSVIEDINREIMSNVTNPEFEILVFENNEISTRKVNDIRYMIANNLKIPVEIINISSEKTLEFVPFYVSLQDQISNYVAERKNGE